MMTPKINQDTLLGVANSLFQEKGFEAVSLKDIANQSQIPIEIIERDYGTPLQLALHIYTGLSHTSYQHAQTLDASTLPDQYYAFLEQRLSLLDEHSEVVSILFSSAMRQRSSIAASDLSSGKSDPIMHSMQALLENSTDAPTRNTDDMTLFLYAFHFLVIIFWLYDRSDSKAASHMFVHFIRDFIKAMRPMLVMPFVIKALRKVSQIMMVVFGGAHIVEPDAGQ